MSGLTIRPLGPDDSDGVAAWVRVANAARAVDCPWEPPLTDKGVAGSLRHGWDGEPSIAFLGVLDAQAQVIGSVNLSERDNRHLAWLGLDVHPEHRRQGLGSLMLDHLLHFAGECGRTSVGADCWDGTPGEAFATGHGFELKSVAVNRRQLLADVDWALVERMHADAQAAASAYELVRRTGPSPDDELDAIAVMASAINDAPTDDLDIEDEVFTAERMRAYEEAQAGQGNRLRRVLVRHRASGELAGHSVVSVDEERPELGNQHDTSVVAAHRGHRLGLLLKTEMNLWLRDAEPQLVHIDTWNAESNDHMIGVNEQIGYRVMGRELEFQRSL